ncbi:F-box protein at5g07670 [Phtheirospermum japonicum]|uniref:F-box protein at5g07670 n=1 Tax=Phtheirospermum japonicum TaxID=374723 RepID=A0A830CTA1_9LAMI|nr:F-box protein at5g07670 [Phtheirospermum japonicum]
MSTSPEKNPLLDPNSNPSTKPKKKRRSSWSDPFSNGRRRRQFPPSGSTTPHSDSEPDSDSSNPNPVDYTSLLSDELLLKVFDKLPDPKQHLSNNSLVCRRWCAVCGKLVRSIKLMDWDFLESGRLSFRFPNLVNINLIPACIKPDRNSGILLSNKLIEVHLSSKMLSNDGFFVSKQEVLDSERIDRGVTILAEGCKKLRKIVLMNVSEEGLNCLAQECELLQEMELHCCDDLSLRGIYNFRNLQILKLIGNINGVYNSVVSDIGMTILAQGCGRLVRLELVGCEGSYDGVKAIGQCCQMLEELTFRDHRMEGGWLSALSYCGNLKTLRIVSCKKIDDSPGLDEHLGSCVMLEELHLRRCQLRDKKGVTALFSVCQAMRKLVIEDCWGLDDGVFAAASIFRNIRSLSLEGCSLVTTKGLESVVLSWKELERLRVDSCNNIKDSEITAELATLFSVLKELKWRPDSRSMLSASLAGTEIGRKGGRSLRN